MSEVQSRRCLVLGGSGSMGSEICRILHREGAQVAFTYHQNREGAEELGREIEGEAIPCDLRHYSQVEEAVAKGAESLGGLDVLVQAAGISGNQTLYNSESGADRLSSISAEEFDEVFAVNTRGTFAACQKAASFLKSAGGGNIIVIGSMDGIKPVPSPVHFATSKAALKGMVEALSKELGPWDIKVNLIAPGIIEGGASESLGEDKCKPYVKHCSLGRLGRPVEVAEVVGWLALENTYLTGQSILLEGGL